MTELHISPVAGRAQVNITHPDTICEPDVGMGSPIFRVPEFVRHGSKRRPPGYTAWETVRENTELRFHWDAPIELKREYATDFSGHLVVEGDEVAFEVTYTNIGAEPASDGLSLFCLQAGTSCEFHDFDGCNTFIWPDDRFISINESVNGEFPDHRMAGAKDCARSVMAKRSTAGFMLAIALDRCSSVTGNFNTWPSCIHATPEWGMLAPGEEATVRGKIYFFAGTLEDVTERYVRDFEAAR